MNIETRRSYWTVVVALLGLFLNAPAYAQVGANVSGVVRDDSAAVLPGVAVTVTNTATGWRCSSRPSTRSTPSAS